MSLSRSQSVIFGPESESRVLNFISRNRSQIPQKWLRMPVNPTSYDPHIFATEICALGLISIPVPAVLARYNSNERI